MLRHIYSCIFGICLLYLWVEKISGDSLHPRRPPTEEEFMKVGHHETSSNHDIFYDKWNKLHSKRSWTSYTFNNSEAKANYEVYMKNAVEIVK